MMSCLHMPKISSQFAIGVEIWRIILAENLTNTKICTYLANICFKNDKKLKSPRIALKLGTQVVEQILRTFFF